MEETMTLRNRQEIAVISLRRSTYFGAFIAAFCCATQATAALPKCSVSALNALAVPNTNFTAAVDVPATAPNPEYCDTLGAVNIQGQTAQFRIQLPANWNGKMVSYGIGGTGGQIASPSANAVDIAEALGFGFATIINDTGHQSASTTDDSFAISSPGVPNIQGIVDYNYRAAHEVGKSAQAMMALYYGSGVKRSYFDGCSGGGRGALNAAVHYPDDYDGIIAGDPGVGQKFLMTLKSAKTQFVPATARIPASLLPTVDAAVYAQCDALDGVQDGLIQNPAVCAFDPHTLLCPAGSTQNCLTADQVNGLLNYYHPLTDQEGNVQYGGYFPSDLSGGSANFISYALGPAAPANPTAAEPWGTATPARGWALGDTQLKFFYARDPNYNSQTFPMTTAGVVDDTAMALYNERIRAFNSIDDDPGLIAPFLNRGGKLIIYNGYSDPSTSPVQTIRYYEQLADLMGGYSAVQSKAQLFMIPGMVHCSGGPAPTHLTPCALLTNGSNRAAPRTSLRRPSM
jgi:hypothetical protein